MVASEREDDSSEARARRKAFIESQDDAPPPPPGDDDTSTPPSLPSLPPGDPLEFARERSALAAVKAWEMLEVAMLDPEKSSTLAMLTSIHNKAIEALIKTDQMIQEILEKRNILIPLTLAEDMARKGYHVMISRLTALPQNVGPRVAGRTPHDATEILHTEAVGIISDIQKQFLPAA